MKATTTVHRHLVNLLFLEIAYEYELIFTDEPVDTHPYESLRKIYYSSRIRHVAPQLFCCVTA